MSSHYMQHHRPVFGDHIAYLASKISTLSLSAMKLRRHRLPGLGLPDTDPPAAAAPAAKKSWKKLLTVRRRNKDRLWVALYKYTGPGVKTGEDAKYQRENPDRPKPVEDPEERKYHWAFLVGPKKEHPYLAVPGTRLEVTANLYSGRWIMYRHYEINIKNTGADMLVRMMVGKIADKRRFYNVVYGVPVDEDNIDAYRNKAWLFEALTALRDAEDGIMGKSSRLDWLEVSELIKSLCSKRAAAGRFDGCHDMNVPRPAFDLIEGRFVWDG